MQCRERLGGLLPYRGPEYAGLRSPHRALWLSHFAQAARPAAVGAARGVLGRHFSLPAVTMATVQATLEVVLLELVVAGALHEVCAGARFHPVASETASTLWRIWK